MENNNKRYEVIFEKFYNLAVKFRDYELKIGGESWIQYDFSENEKILFYITNEGEVFSFEFFDIRFQSYYDNSISFPYNTSLEHLEEVYEKVNNYFENILKNKITEENKKRVNEKINKIKELEEQIEKLKSEVEND